MQKAREHWSTQIGFILAAAGSAIGLGTLWKVPYVIGQNGGGLFFLFYIFCIFFIGIPVFIAELILGRRAQRAAVGIFASLSNNSSVWKATGWIGVAASFILMSYYSVVAGWGLNYVFMCLNQFYLNLSPPQISEVFSIVESSGDITLFWTFLFISITVIVVLPGVREGIEYWSKFMTSSLFILLIILCAYSFTLEGFNQAIHFLLYPDFKEFKASSALEALGLSFFTLSLGQGIMLTYGSYMRRSEDIPKIGGIIGLTITLASLLAGLMIFPIIFTFGFKPQEGTGLIFKTLPLLFGQLHGALILSTAFFILFTFAALTSTIAMVEVVAANFMDLFGWNRKKAVLSTAIGAFIFGIPSALSQTNTLFANWPRIYGKTFFQTADNLVSVWLLTIGGFMIALFTGWRLSKEAIQEEFELGSAYRWLFGPWFFFMRWIVPVAIFLIFLQSTGLIDIDKWFKPVIAP